jgi:hypothetical protein
MSERVRLPNRRGHELLDFEHGGIRYTAGIGRFEDGSWGSTGQHGGGTGGGTQVVRTLRGPFGGGRNGACTHQFSAG